MSKTAYSDMPVITVKQLTLRNSEDTDRLLLLKHVKVEVKVTLVQALKLCTVRTAHRGSRGTALPFHDHSTRRG